MFNQKRWSLHTHGFISSSINSSCITYLHSYLSYEINTSASCSFFIHLFPIKDKLPQTPWPLSNYWLHPFISKCQVRRHDLSSVIFHPCPFEYCIPFFHSWLYLFLEWNNRPNDLFFISRFNLIEIKIQLVIKKGFTLQKYSLNSWIWKETKISKITCSILSNSSAI